MPSYAKAAVGVFILGGLLLFAVGLFWIGDRRQLFTESMELYTEFANVSALARGAKVRVAGMDAGEILEIRTPPDPDSRFRIRFRVISDFKPILRTDSVATIQTDGIVGATFLQVEAGTSAAEVLTEGATISSREPVEISDLLEGASATLSLANRAILEVTEGIDETVESVLHNAARPRGHTDPARFGAAVGVRAGYCRRRVAATIASTASAGLTCAVSITRRSPSQAR